MAGRLALDVVLGVVILLEYIGWQAEGSAVEVHGDESVFTESLVDDRVADVEHLRVVPVLRSCPCTRLQVSTVVRVLVVEDVVL